MKPLLAPGLLPRLVKDLDPTPSRLDELWQRFTGRSAALKRGQQVVAAFHALGPLAAPAIPLLTNLADNSRSGYKFAPAALVAIGPAAMPAFFDLLCDPSRKGYVFFLLSFVNGVGNGTIPPSGAASAIPALLAGLSSSNHVVRWYAAHGLGAISISTNGVAPALLKLVQDPNREVAKAAVGAFIKILAPIRQTRPLHELDKFPNEWDRLLQTRIVTDELLRALESTLERAPASLTNDLAQALFQARAIKAKAAQ